MLIGSPLGATILRAWPSESEGCFRTSGDVLGNNERCTSSGRCGEAAYPFCMRPFLSEIGFLRPLGGEISWIESEDEYMRCRFRGPSGSGFTRRFSTTV